MEGGRSNPKSLLPLRPLSHTWKDCYAALGPRRCSKRRDKKSSQEPFVTRMAGEKTFPEDLGPQDSQQPPETSTLNSLHGAQGTLQKSIFYLMSSSLIEFVFCNGFKSMY